MSVATLSLNLKNSHVHHYRACRPDAGERKFPICSSLRKNNNVLVCGKVLSSGTESHLRVDASNIHHKLNESIRSFPHLVLIAQKVVHVGILSGRVKPFVFMVP